MIFGAVVDDSLTSHIKVTVVASGFREGTAAQRVERAAREPAPGKRERQSVEPVDIPTFLRRR
jgi:cell division GTPase FtsZ